MKKSHIFLLVVIAIAVSVVISTAGDASSYVNFKTAKEMKQNGDDNMVHVVGELKKDGQGKVVGIKPSNDRLSFSFIMVDDSQQEQLVFYKEPVPADFTKSEKVVVIGNYYNETFVADKILLKCPSKYEETEIKPL
ncbi:MAG: cytochrome c maturation protein CcmE [Cytophagales bacterium]|nr:cytochrome c maturation protein CcmE [Cytophagales bacterium]